MKSCANAAKHRRFLTDILPAATQNRRRVCSIFSIKDSTYERTIQFLRFSDHSKILAPAKPRLKGHDLQRHDDFRTSISMNSCPLDRPRPQQYRPLEVQALHQTKDPLPEAAPFIAGWTRYRVRSSRQRFFANFFASDCRKYAGEEDHLPAETRLFRGAVCRRRPARASTANLRPRFLPAKAGLPTVDAAPILAVRQTA